MNKLTNEEISRVFAMYFGCDVQFTFSSNYFDWIRENRKARVIGIVENNVRVRPITRDGKVDFSNFNSLRVDVCKLLLSPLSEITDEDAIALFKAKAGVNTNEDKAEILSIIRGKNHVQLNYRYIHPDMNYNNDDGYSYSAWAFSTNTVSDIVTFQQLISLGYSVPLWFGINHWANAKAPIELGIAIDKTLK